jgi:hypothetical protein
VDLELCVCNGYESDASECCFSIQTKENALEAVSLGKGNGVLAFW